MHCKYCGHHTGGPFPYCDADCELDYELAQDPLTDAQDDAGALEMTDIGLDPNYQTPDYFDYHEHTDEPDDPLRIDHGAEDTDIQTHATHHANELTNA